MHLNTFFTKSFCDSLGVPDGGRVTQFVLVCLFVAIVAVGLVFDRWAPDYLTIGLLGAITGQSVAVAWENRGKQRTDADIATASITGETPAGPATATTQTTTTISTAE
ncbi:hypothetical protein ACVWYF_004136 [Hymenobacter sp. UYAg731]